LKDILADRTRAIDASGIRKVFALAASLHDPVDFSIGQPHFDVPDELKAEAVRAIRGGFNKYCQTSGDEVLRGKIGESLEKRYGWRDSSVLITSGVSGGLLLAFMALLNEGDEVIIPDPYFVIYKHVVNMLGARCVFVDTYDDFRLPVDKIAGRITGRTKLIVVNSPCNPTGAVYDRGRLRELARIASQKDVLVLSDRIYDAFCYDGDFSCIGDFYPNTLVMGGFSKAYAMSGWRLGYAAANGPLREIIEQMTKIQQYTFVCAPSPFQKAAAAAMDYDTGDIVAAYRKKRDMVYEGLRDRFELARPAGAFYAFAKAPGGSGTKFAEKAVANNVLVIPGKVFSERDTHFRISFAAADEKIERGVGILNRLAGGG
jgi:aspartate aminotransferase/aminotransferase